MLETLGYHQVSGGATGVETAADVESSSVELQITLIEPDVGPLTEHSPGPGPGEALLLVLHHVDGGGGQEVGQEEPEVTPAGAEVDHEMSRPGQPSDGPRQAGELGTLPLQPGLGQVPSLGVDGGGEVGPVQGRHTAQLLLLQALNPTVSPPVQ